MDGCVVHARRGDRNTYKPLASVLCASSQPRVVVEALLGLYPFEILYIADLDAIQRRGNNFEAIRQLRRQYPRLRLWVDSGVGDAAALDRFTSLELGRAVIGSETLTETALLSHNAFNNPRRAPVLSLDFRSGQRLLGPAALAATPALWPRQVIVMSLTRVGSTLGPDFVRLRGLRNLAPQTELLAAGGVRDAVDLAALEALDMSGVLLASALHEGRLGPEALARYA